MSNNAVKDSFELALDEKKEALEQCQRAKNTNSCYNCEELFDCQTRTQYVKAVYESMSKGKNDGGFDF